MLVQFIDAASKKAVAVNPDHVASVFLGKNEEGEEKTVVNLLNGNVVVDDDYLEVVGRIQGELNQK